LLGKHYDGHALNCDDGKKTFHFSVNHKKRKSGSLHLFGTTRGGLCYTRPAVPPMPTTEGTAEMSLDATDKAAISMVKDHPKNSHQHELKLHANCQGGETTMASTIGTLRRRATLSSTCVW